MFLKYRQRESTRTISLKPFDFILGTDDAAKEVNIKLSMHIFHEYGRYYLRLRRLHFSNFSATTKLFVHRLKLSLWVTPQCKVRLLNSRWSVLSKPSRKKKSLPKYLSRMHRYTNSGYCYRNSNCEICKILDQNESIIRIKRN